MQAAQNVKVSPQKAEAVKKIRENFENAVSTVLIDFRGLTVSEAEDLRGRFRAKGVEYRVVKNTLIRKAIQDTDLSKNEAFTGQLKGQTGVAWGFEDPSTAAKIIKDFRKEEPTHEEHILVKCGLLEGQVFEGKQVESQLATLPGKDEIRAQLLAQLLAPAQSLVRQLVAPAQNMIYALDAKTRKDNT